MVKDNVSPPEGCPHKQNISLLLVPKMLPYWQVVVVLLFYALLRDKILIPFYCSTLMLNIGALMFQIHMKPEVVLLFGLGLN